MRRCKSEGALAVAGHSSPKVLIVALLTAALSLAQAKGEGEDDAFEFEYAARGAGQCPTLRKPGDNGEWLAQMSLLALVMLCLVILGLLYQLYVLADKKKQLANTVGDYQQKEQRRQQQEDRRDRYWSFGGAQWRQERRDREVQCDLKPTTSSVGSQAPVTYKRWWQKPEFRCLPEHLHG